MYIKTSKGEVRVANWMIMFGLLVVDNMFANHCKKKTVGEVAKKAVESAVKAKAES